MNKVTNFSEISGLDGLDKSFEVASIVYSANQKKSSVLFWCNNVFLTVVQSIVII